MVLEATERDGGELAALRDLQQSEGWKLLLGYLEREWGPAGYGWRMQKALSEIPRNGERAYEIARIAEQIDATSEAVNQITSWPQERIQQLAAPAKATGPFAGLRRIGR